MKGTRAAALLLALVATKAWSEGELPLPPMVSPDAPEEAAPKALTPPPVLPATPESPESPGDSQAPGEAVAPNEAKASPPSRYTRVRWEVGLGYAGGAAVGLTGLLTGCLIDATASNRGCQTVALVGGIGGAMLGMSLGVWAGGYLRDGDGWLLAVLGGELAGALTAGLLALAVRSQAVSDLAVLTLPLAGAIAGYELTSCEGRSLHDPKPTLAPAIAPTADGKGAWLGLTGRY